MKSAKATFLLPYLQLSFIENIFDGCFYFWNIKVVFKEEKKSLWRFLYLPIE